MSTPSKQLVILTLLAACLFAGAGGLRFWRASRSLAEARSTDEACTTLFAEVRQLRSLPRLVDEAPLREERLLAMVSDCVAQAGINPTAIRETISEKSAAPVAGYQRQGIRAQLDGLELQDIGKLLHQFASNHPTWIPTMINLSPSANKPNSDRATWNCAIVLTSTHITGMSGAPQTLLPEVPAK